MVDFAEENEGADGSWYRRFFLVRLPPERLAEAHPRHSAFQRFVGTHCDYGPDGHRTYSGRRESSEHPAFYDAYPPGSNGTYLDCEVIGWFER